MEEFSLAINLNKNIKDGSKKKNRVKNVNNGKLLMLINELKAYEINGKVENLSQKAEHFESILPGMNVTFLAAAIYLYYKYGFEFFDLDSESLKKQEIRMCMNNIYGNNDSSDNNRDLYNKVLVGIYSYYYKVCSFG